jgi:CheY-like chemotaxis protein
MVLKILVVDDDETIVFLHEFMVKESGLSEEPISFYDGKRTLDYILANAESQDAFLILLDINMPVMNGWEFLNAIRRYNFSNPIFVVIVTSSLNTEDREKASTYKQVIDYIEKPVDSKVLKCLKELKEIKKYF